MSDRRRSVKSDQPDQNRRSVVQQSGGSTPMKPLLVGEVNPYGSSPQYALYPEPRGATGDRLCRLIMEISEEDYLSRFDRVNLCVGKWSLPVARESAKEIVFGAKFLQIVLLGRKVCAAFGVTSAPFTRAIGGSTNIVVLPHPSGLNRVWNEPGAFERAQRTLREAGVL